MPLFDNIIQKIENGVKLENQMSAVIAHNVANIDNPQFKRIAFSKSLQEARKKLGLDEKVIDDYDGDEVNLEKELVAFGKSKIRHAAYLKLLGLRFGILKKVVSQGRG